MTENFRSIALMVNGEDVRETVEARTSLVDFLRDRLGLTGSHVGCEQGVCGACTVRLDGVTVRGCLVLAVQCAGSRVETIEGVSDTGEIADLQDAFVRRNALQCGFCTPGVLLNAQELLASREHAGSGAPSRDEIRAHLSGSYCRCTGYQAIVDAVEAVAQSRLSSPSPSNRIRQLPNSTCLAPKSGEPDFGWRAGAGSFPRQELAARAPTLPFPASGGGKEEGTP